MAHRGELVISRKAIAQGMSDCLRCPVCSCAQPTPPLRTGPRVQRASGIPCSLFLEGEPLEDSGALRRGNANARHALKCQNMAASMANFRHTMTAKRGDPGMRDGGGVIPEHFPKEAF